MTQIGSPLPHLAPSETQDASPFGSPASLQPPALAAASPAKKSLVLPIAVAVMLATSAVAYFSGAFTPKPVQIAEPSTPTVTSPAEPKPAPQPTSAEPIPVAATPLAAAALTDLLTQTQDCGPLRLSNPPAAGYAETDAVQISGRVGSDASEAAMKAKLAPLTGTRPLKLVLEQLNPAICAVLNALPELGSGGSAVSLGYGDTADPNPEGHYVTGQNPVIDVTVPGGAGYLSVVVVDGSGQVLHLAQGLQQAVPGKLRVAFPVAEAGVGRPALMVNPAGLGIAMILVLRSEAALETGPVIEPVAAFVARVKRVKLISMDQRLLNLTAR